MPRLLTPPLVLALIAAASLPAAAEDGPVPDVVAESVGPTPETWLRIGLERYEHGNLIGAIEAFERGYQREPRPMFLFALGQAHRKRGDCDRARAMYDAFLATGPTAAQADAAREQRALCEPVAAPVAEPPPPAPAPAPAPGTVAPPPPSRRGWTRDPVAIGAGAATVGLVGTGVALWLAADKAASAAAATDSYDRHLVLRERAESRQLQAAVVLSVGVAAGAVTVWRLTRRRDEPRRELAWRPLVSRAGVGLAVGGQF